MLESVVRGSREDVVGAAELLQVAKSLKLRSVDDLDQQLVKRHRAVNWIIEYLEQSSKTEDLQLKTGNKRIKTDLCVIILRTLRHMIISGINSIYSHSMDTYTVCRIVYCSL